MRYDAPWKFGAIAGDWPRSPLWGTAGDRFGLSAIVHFVVPQL